MRRPVLVLALVAPLLLTGCGGGSSKASSDGSTTTDSPSSSAAPAEATKATDLCPLITPAEMSTVLGYEVAFKRDPSNGCSYDSVKADARTEPSVGITTQLLVDGTGDFAGTKTGAASAAQGTAVDLPGVGEQAFTVTSGPSSDSNIAEAVALVKGQVVTISLVGGGAANRAKLAPIATTILKLAVSKV